MEYLEFEDYWAGSSDSEKIRKEQIEKILSAPALPDNVCAIAMHRVGVDFSKTYTREELEAISGSGFRFEDIFFASQAKMYVTKAFPEIFKTSLQDIIALEEKIESYKTSYKEFCKKNNALLEASISNARKPYEQLEAEVQSSEAEWDSLNRAGAKFRLGGKRIPAPIFYGEKDAWKRVLALRAKRDQAWDKYLKDKGEIEDAFDKQAPQKPQDVAEAEKFLASVDYAFNF